MKSHVIGILEGSSIADERPRNMSVDAFLR